MFWCRRFGNSKRRFFLYGSDDIIFLIYGRSSYYQFPNKVDIYQEPSISGFNLREPFFPTKTVKNWVSRFTLASQVAAAKKTVKTSDLFFGLLVFLWWQNSMANWKFLKTQRLQKLLVLVEVDGFIFFSCKSGEAEINWDTPKKPTEKKHLSKERQSLLPQTKANRISGSHQ